MLRYNYIVTDVNKAIKHLLNKDKQKGKRKMRSRTVKVNTGSRLMDTEELRAYTNLGRNNAMKLGEEIGAKVQIGRRVLWDRVKIDQYFNSLTGVK